MYGVSHSSLGDQSPVPPKVSQLTLIGDHNRSGDAARQNTQFVNRLFPWYIPSSDEQCLLSYKTTQLAYIDFCDSASLVSIKSTVNVIAFYYGLFSDWNHIPYTLDLYNQTNMHEIVA